MFCLPKQQTEIFLEKIRSGELNPEKLVSMTSAERRSYFSSFLDDATAKQVNTLLERKLILKNQQKGILNWAKQISNIDQKTKADLIERINKMENILSPNEKTAFLDDLVAAKLGFGATKDEASNILKLSQKAASSKEKMLNSQRRGVDGNPTKTELEYGRDAVAMANYVNDLKYKAEKVKLTDFFKRPMRTITEVAGQTKSLSSSMDNSALFRQGWKTMWTNPKIWFNNAKKSFADISRTFGGKDTVNELNARIISDPNYDKMRRAGLAVGSIEEAFPTKLPENIPIFSKAYKASQDAYSNFLHKTRADVFNQYVAIADNLGIDTTNDEFLKATGKYINALTGRSDLGKFEPAANFLNNVFFSPRLFVSHFESLLSPATSKNAFIRKQAAINVLKMAAGFATVLGIARAINPKAVEFDPRSSDFGKIKVGKTRFDVSGGLGSILVLAARMVNGAYKSSTSGKVTEYDSGFGGKTRFDALVEFASNKASPIGSTIINILEGETFEGDKPTILSELTNMYVPLGFRNIWESVKEEDRPNLLILILADALGIGTNTY